MALGELVMSLVILAIAVFLYLDTLTFPTFPQYGAVDSDFWPKIILALLIFCSAMLVGETLHKRRSLSQQEQKKQEDYDPRGLSRMLGTGALLMIYIFIGLQYLGFLLSTLLFTVALMYWLGNRKPWLLVLVPLLVSGCGVAIFCRIMMIPLPRGIGVFRLLSQWFY